MSVRLLATVILFLVPVASAQTMTPAETLFHEPILFPDAGSWGVNVHTPQHMAALKPLGCQWVRLDSHWHVMEAATRGQYNWERTDKVINSSLDQGYRVICILNASKMNPLYEQDKADKDLIIDAIAKTYAAAVGRYKGKGIVWEIGNEPEVFPMGDYWKDPITYTKLARRSAKLMKQADPDCLIAALSLAWMDRSFASAALDAGLLADGTIDMLSFHGYHRPTPMPESGLAEDVTWLRAMARRYAPRGKRVIVIDSECGYAVIPRDTPKPWGNWRIQLYSETEQAAYLARHYLEEIALGLEISIWYKDMNGENAFSLYYGDENDPRGLRPMGHVYRNLASLLPDNPKKMVNDQYAVSLVDPPDKIPAPDSFMKVRPYLRSYRVGQDAHLQLIVAVWNPVEAFDGKILQKRERVKDKYDETWRDITSDDVVDVPLQIQVAGMRPQQVKTMSSYDLLAKETATAWQPLAAVPVEGSANTVRTPVLKVGPMPTVIVIDLNPTLP